MPTAATSTPMRRVVETISSGFNFLFDFSRGEAGAGPSNRGARISWPSQPHRTIPVALLPYPPPPRYISGPIELDQGQVTIHGGYNDVSKGYHATLGTLVLRRSRQRFHNLTSNNHSQAFAHMVELWLGLQHPNILPFLGLYVLDGDTYTVSPWAANGTVVRYIREHPGVCRRALLLQAAEGLLYLHRREIIHGDVKPLNMLVTADGQVQLCDFDLSRPATDPTYPIINGASTVQYESPESMMDKNVAKTFKSDVYAFGMTIYEVLSGKAPFGITASAIFYAVLFKKERPPRDPIVSPSGESYAALWDLANDCWDEDPERRPTMEQVVRRLKESAPS
ncbi:hypothetical protein FRB99_000353 [Tulasnella sp. 403]|nr:hypothetical protein FRB99_000353 [Tulasnella sp. 403]